MPDQSFEARLREAVEACEKCNGNKTHASDMLNIDRSTLRGRLAAAWRLLGLAPNVPQVPVPQGTVLGKTTMQVDGRGNVSQQWARLHPSQEQMETFVESMLDSVNKKGPTIPAPKVKGDILQIIIGDPHAGMYAWAKETGCDYDIDIFLKLHLGAIKSLIDRAPPCSEIILTWLGDLMHSDSKLGTTKSGHILDMDGRFGAIIDAVQQCVNGAIEYAARKAGKVTVIFCKGNHDDASSSWIQRLVSAWWRNTKHVTVPIFEGNRHYMRRGSVLLGVHHGDKIAGNRLAHLMATESPDWSATRHRYYDCGHVHHSKKLAPAFDTEEHPGCIVEYHRVMAGLEAYGHEAGYCASRAMTARILSDKYGAIGTLIVTPEMLQ